MLKALNILDITNPKQQKVTRLYKKLKVDYSTQCQVDFAGDYMALLFFKNDPGDVSQINKREYYTSASDLFDLWVDVMSGQYAQFGYVIARGETTSIDVDVDWDDYIEYP